MKEGSGTKDTVELPAQGQRLANSNPDNSDNQRESEEVG